MKPKLGRRAALLFTSLATWHPPHSTAIPPPKGSAYLLVPLVQQRLLLAECSAAIAKPGTNWTSLLGLFDGAPFTEPRANSRVVGNAFRSAAAQYEKSLVYETELSGADRKVCFPQPDSDCIRLQIDSDRGYRELVINDVLSALQSVEEELAFLSGCERGVVQQGLTCPADLAADTDEITKALSTAGASFDRYFDLVPAADARAAVGVVASTSPRWDLVPLDDGTSAGASAAGTSTAGTSTAGASAEGASAAGARSKAPTMMQGQDEGDEAGGESPHTAATTTGDASPTIATLARFALPTLAAWLVSPLMSLVDTAVVGRDRSASSLALAALGPATMVGDSMSYLCSFLSVATTNLVATALADGGAGSSSGSEPSQPPGSAERAGRLAEVFGTAVRLAVLCGVASALAQLTFGRAVLGRYTAARSAALVAPAFEYVRVRAIGAPAALLVRVGTATCLATKDPLTPLLAVAASGALNLCLDVLLVSCLGFGIAGAAWATVASEAVCAAIVLRAVCAKIGGGGRAGGGTSSGMSGEAADGPLPSRGLLPSRAATATYASFARPLVVTLVGKIATYSSLAHVATTVSVAGTAAHRVLMCVYCALANPCLKPHLLPGPDTLSPT